MPSPFRSKSFSAANGIILRRPRRTVRSLPVFANLRRLFFDTLVSSAALAKLTARGRSPTASDKFILILLVHSRRPVVAAGPSCNPIVSKAGRRPRVKAVFLRAACLPLRTLSSDVYMERSRSDSSNLETARGIAGMEICHYSQAGGILHPNSAIVAVAHSATLGSTLHRRSFPCFQYQVS